VGKTPSSRSRFGAPLVLTGPAPRPARPRAYQAGLQIRPSHHRPKCLAHERLMLWTSPYKVGAMDVYNRRLPQLDHDFLRQVEICANSIMISTRTTYGSALLIYNVWCDSMLIDDAARIPTSTTIIISWVSAMTASYATKTISGYVDAIKTWHENQVPWRVTEDIVDCTIMGSAAFVPPESNWEKREPYTIEMLASIKSKLTLTAPADAAVWAVCCIAFFGLGRLGKLCPKNGNYSKLLHPSRADIWYAQSRNHESVRDSVLLVFSTCSHLTLRSLYSASLTRRSAQTVKISTGLLSSA
jgi:hypothetical protein